MPKRGTVKFSRTRVAKARGIYPLYRFKDHDPILDEIDTLRALTELTLTKLAELSHMSLGTLVNWHKRHTKRPQFASIKATIRAMGYDIVLVDGKGKVIK